MLKWLKKGCNQAKELGRRTVDFGISITQKMSVIIGIVCLLASYLFAIFFVGSYELFFMAVSDNLFISIAIIVVGALLASSFLSEILFMLIPETMITKIAVALQIPIEAALVILLIILVALFSALSALAFLTIAFISLGIGLMGRLLLKASSKLDILASIVLLGTAILGIISGEIIGLLSGIIFGIMGIGYLIPVKK